MIPDSIKAKVKAGRRLERKARKVRVVKGPGIPGRRAGLGWPGIATWDKRADSRTLDKRGVLGKQQRKGKEKEKAKLIKAKERTKERKEARKGRNRDSADP